MRSLGGWLELAEPAWTRRRHPSVIGPRFGFPMAQRMQISAEKRAPAWPDGARSAVCFTFDLDAEEVWLVDEEGAAERPAVLSQGTYGPRVALPLILGILARHGVRGTFFVPGRVAERHPASVAAILEAGHEIAHHGYSHRSPATLAPDEERRELEAGLEALAGRGVVATGYRAPGWDVSPRTIDLVAELGFAYSSNLMDDIAPYVHAGAGIVELPVHWTLDDAPHFWFSPSTWTKAIASAAHVAGLWKEEADGIARLGGLCVYTCHPQIIGRPGRLGVLEAAIAAAVDQKDRWVATAGEVAAWVKRSSR